MNKYYWSFDEMAETWCESGESIMDCIEQARAQNDDGYETVFIGECVPFDIHNNLNVHQLLESLEESAYEFCGEAAEGWDAYNPRKHAEIDELRDAIAPAVIGWLEKYGRTPTFCAIENVAEYDITGERTVCVG